MSKDLIIGGASGYKYDDVKYWINSIQRSGFDGDIVLLVTNISAIELEKISQKNIKILAYGPKDENGNYSSNSQMPPHVERFFHIWNYLNETVDQYDTVIATDVRDVVFQLNPQTFLHSMLTTPRFIGEKEYDLLAAGEGLKYKDEPWGNQNYYQAFGPYFHNMMKEKQINNVGIIAGKHEIVRDLVLLLLQLSINRPIPIVDQAVYNFLLYTDILKSKTIFTSNDSDWAVNMGTTLEAITSGSGDIGQKNDPTSILLYQTKYLCNQPFIEPNGTVCNSKKLPFRIVHQYDRIAGLAEKIRIMYDD